MPCCVVLSSVSSYEIHQNVLNQEVHYRPDKTQILFHILYQINPNPYLAFSFLKSVVIFSLNSNLDFQNFFKIKGLILKNFCPCFSLPHNRHHPHNPHIYFYHRKKYLKLTSWNSTQKQNDSFGTN